MEARIIRDDGTDADVDEVGELYLRGGNIALGYWDNEEATKETFVDGWLRTGDKFRVNKGGGFFVRPVSTFLHHWISKVLIHAWILVIDSFADRAKVPIPVPLLLLGSSFVTH